nr:MAG TPA: formylglycinamide ribonucleotide amidotransferase [Bacteriophage sp.]
MTENEAIERIKYRMLTAEHVAGGSGMEDLEMAIKALEEVQRWHTSVINPNIKNEFANTSTQICHNCDHKDEYIEELEAEVEEYRTIGTPEECLRNKDFLDFLSDKMNPNDFETYLRLYNALEEKGCEE